MWCILLPRILERSSGVVVRSTGAYKRLSGRQAGPVLGWVARVEYPVPKHYTCWMFGLDSENLSHGSPSSFGWDVRSRPSHKLNQCSHIVNYTLRVIFQWNCSENWKVSIQRNVFDNIVCEMAAILSWPESVNPTKVACELHNQFLNQNINPLSEDTYRIAHLH